MKTLTGKTVVITGASSGIGEATARLLAHKGEEHKGSHLHGLLPKPHQTRENL